ncbi:MAG TPA: hypothetical protein VKT20_05380 [Candidatus Dormibacteraeota bacterium]|nr:hypothetical protein [Candidatus Dormibacteraeota bacterium]
MTRVVRAVIAGFAAAAALLAFPAAVSADPPQPIPYRQAIAEAYDVVTAASPGDVQSANVAAGLVRQGTGTTQPEILADLLRRPPNFQDAAARLKALLDAIDNPASTDDPAGAAAKLRDVLAMSRYDALHRPPSAIQRFLNWLYQRFLDFLRFLFGGNGVGGVIPTWVVYAIGVAMLGAVLLIVVLSSRGRFTGSAELMPGGPRAPADYFAEADRLAASGDRVGALRALCAGVAGTLAGERTWEGSPLTVREIFQRAPDPKALRPLLTPFEAAVYGGRDVDAATYERAAAVAAPFRRPVEKAA